MEGKGRRGDRVSVGSERVSTHYGQTVEDLRWNGVVPATSRPKSD
jgi:hypothetical protein